MRSLDLLLRAIIKYTYDLYLPEARGKTGAEELCPARNGLEMQRGTRLLNSDVVMEVSCTRPWLIRRFRIRALRLRRDSGVAILRESFGSKTFVWDGPNLFGARRKRYGVTDYGPSGYRIN